MSKTGRSKKPWNAGLGRWIWPLLIAGVAAVMFSFDAHRLLTLETLHVYQLEIEGWVTRYFALAMIVYLCVFVLVIVLVLPGGALMTVAGGYLFGIGLGSLLAAVGSTLGGGLLFLATRGALSSLLGKIRVPRMMAASAKVRQRPVPYLFALRLIPVLPFSLVTLLAASLDIGLGAFFGATFVGVMPSVLAFTSIGSALDLAVNAQDQVISPHLLYLQIGLGGLGLVLLALAARLGKSVSGVVAYSPLPPGKCHRAGGISSE